MKINIVWMDGMEREYEATSARVWDGVLVLQDATRTGTDTATYTPLKYIRFPVANIREWTE